MNIRKIKKVVDGIYFILICASFLALIAFYPIMLLLIGAFILFRIYINDLYESNISKNIDYQKIPDLLDEMEKDLDAKNISKENQEVIKNTFFKYIYKLKGIINEIR